MELTEPIELPKAIDKSQVLKYLDEQIKEKNDQWSKRLMDLTIAKEKVAGQNISEEEIDNFQKVQKVVFNKSQKAFDSIIKRLPEQEKLDYQKVSEWKHEVEAIDLNEKGMTRLEKMIEVAKEVKSQIEGK